MGAHANGPTWAQGLTFKVADADEARQALDLRRDIYTAELGPPGLDQYDQGAQHLVAIAADEGVVATLRLAVPEQRPFDLENLVDLDEVLPDLGRAGDLSRFCVRADYRRVRKDQFIHLGMLKLLYDVAKGLRLDHLVTIALPHLEPMYRAVFFEQVPGGDLVHPSFGQVRLMCFDVAGAESRYRGSGLPFAKVLFGERLTAVGE